MPTRTTSQATATASRKRPRLSRKTLRLIELLRQWREEGDKEEQRETGEFLKKALDEDRHSYRKLFP